MTSFKASQHTKTVPTDKPAAQDKNLEIDRVRVVGQHHKQSAAVGA